ncbi:MAG: asparagine--tRNA ligase [Planctomycetes bacterium RBG_16_43_13]|nr:MAG: asparagine--tRNA ligase [Planctomycetes bacterium RBG_16_43_13]
MGQIYIEELKKHIGSDVTIKGWLYNRRSKGKIQFLLVRDGTGVVQCVVVKGEVSDEIFDKCDKISQESSIVVSGQVREDKRSDSGVEVSVIKIDVISESKEYPIQIQDVVPDVGFLMSNRHLWLRSRKQNAVLRIRAEVVRAIRDFFDSKGFICVDAPILTPSACEGTTTLFEVDYFDEKAYLTQSGQLYAEAAAMAFGKVYCFGPTFRAERSKTRKHLTEFWMVEPEVAYLELDGLMELAEQFVSHIVSRVLESRQNELKILERDIKLLERISPPFPRIRYDEAVKIVQDSGIKFNWGEDFGAPHEEAIVKGFGKPVMVHRYPASMKAFYMQPDPNEPKYALCVDMLAPEGFGEIIGGSQRVYDLNLLEKRITEHKLPREAFEWYLDLRRYGSVPHSGFGLGVERTVAWICGTEHVRECIPFPRMLYKIYP